MRAKRVGRTSIRKDGSRRENDDKSNNGSDDTNDNNKNRTYIEKNGGLSGVGQICLR